jgi:hypothetical protein
MSRSEEVSFRYGRDHEFGLMPEEGACVVSDPEFESKLVMVEETLKIILAHLELHGLDYLDEDQAAYYCRLGVSTFREQVRFLCIPRLKMLGTRRIVYRRADLQRAVEYHITGGVPANSAIDLEIKSRKYRRHLKLRRSGQ